MARVGIVFGLLLCGTTFAGLVATTAKVPTQFVPMMLGIPVLFCGVVALNPHRRKTAMQTATAVASFGALSGLLWGLYRLLEFAGGESVDGFAIKIIAVTSLQCAVFVAICLTLFAQTRRRTSDSESVSPTITARRSPNSAPVSGVTSRENA